MLLYYLIFWPTFFLSVNGLSMVFQHRIAGGEKSSIESQPYMVSIRYGKLTTRCSASIISKNHVLTAAHCISDDFHKLKIRAGSDYERINGTEHRVESFVRHENYKLNYWNNGVVSVNDIAVIKVVPSFEFGPTCQAISMFNAGEMIEAGSSGIVSGWGSVPFAQSVHWSWEEKIFNKLESVVVPIFEESVCMREHKKRNYILKPGQICAGGNGKGSCRGDSGAPLVVNGRQAGLVSWGYGCELLRYPPTIYTEVAYFRKWIDEQVYKLSGDSRQSNEHVTDRPKMTTNMDKLDSYQGINYYQGNPVWS